MALTFEEYERLVQRLQDAARRHPWDYRVGVARFALRRGRSGEARAYRRRGDQVRDWVHEYHMERARIRPDDTFSVHDLSAAWLERIHAALSAHHGIREAYLVRNNVRHAPARVTSPRP